MAYKRKTVDRWDILGNCGYGWEVENSEYTREDAKRSLKEYRENCDYPIKMEKHRERIDEQERLGGGIGTYDIQLVKKEAIKVGEASQNSV